MSEDGARAAAGTARARGAAVAVRRVPVVLALALASGCRGGDWRVSQLYGGATSIDVITHPETVEAFRVSPDPPPADSEAPRVGDFAVTAGPVPVTADDAAELAAVLMDPDTYDWHRAKGCEFTPG